MEIEELKSKTDEMLKKLVDNLGLDGNYYVSVSKCPIVYTNVDGLCKFLSARSKELKEFLEHVNLDDKKKEYIFNEGLIVINKSLKNGDNFDRIDLYVSLLHEKLHSNRMLLINSQHPESREVSGVFYDSGKFVRNYQDQPYYVDSSQEVLKASIDDSRKTYEKYSSMSLEDKKEMTENNFEYDDKLYEQYKIDEALVETMAIVANRLYEKNTNDIMSVVRDLNHEYDGDIKAITSIVLRHNDLELFKWMIDPISYEIGVSNYDFFRYYITPDDMGDFNDLMESEDTMFDDDAFDNYIISSRKK